MTAYFSAVECSTTELYQVGCVRKIKISYQEGEDHRQPPVTSSLPKESHRATGSVDRPKADLSTHHSKEGKGSWPISEQPTRELTLSLVTKKAERHNSGAFQFFPKEEAILDMFV